MYKTEPHLHTFPVSSCAFLTPEEIVARYREAGFDTLIVSDHFAKYHFDKLEAHLGESLTWERYVELFFTGFEAAKAAGDKLGLRVLCSAELTLGPNHYLLYGADRAFFLALPGIFDMTIEAFYPIAKARGVTVIQAHPLRDGKCVPKPEVVDGFEVFNSHPRHDNRNEDVLALAARYPRLLQTAGSDAHRIQDIGGTAVLSDTPVETVEDYLALLRSGKATFLNRREET